MPPIRLQSFTHTAGLSFYLDTSAVFPLALAYTGEPLEQLEQTRCNLLTPFLEQVMKANSRAVYSILALEELAAKIRNKTMRSILDQRHHSDWPSYERSSQAQADADLLIVQGQTLRMLKHAVDALNKADVGLAHPALPDAQTGKKLRKVHREFLSHYPRIDSMDALHLAVGGLIGCKHFVSFDKAWADITHVQLLN